MSKLELTVAAMRRAGERTGLDGDAAEAITRNWMVGAHELLVEQIIAQTCVRTLHPDRVASEMVHAPEKELVDQRWLFSRLQSMLRRGEHAAVLSSLDIRERIQ